MFKFFKEIKRRKAQGDEFKPWYIIAIILPLYPIYWICKKFAVIYENAL